MSDTVPPTKTEDRWAVSLLQARSAPIPEGARSAPMMEHGSMVVRFYAPEGEDKQTPHDQDEVYVVVSGSGKFINGDQEYLFGPGDVLFAPAGAEHRFVDFSEDFETWVIFYGPEGGEAAD